ncbi:hypothetical protein IFM89_027490 [Coptis chinensis]|uniref:Uncharacterized protein n=1 Tax=Coptis chinensis TaxID=261450 RepID=A0A835M1B1_9MAGN|nr:hypothetical protein IFM89_027490 [Coptis chinensis]
MEDESIRSIFASLDHISDVDEKLFEVRNNRLVSMKKKKKKSKVMEGVNDNLDDNVNVEDVPTDGGGPSIEGLAPMVDGNETDYASSDDHDSPEVSSEEDEMRPRNELKGALKDYAVAIGCPVKWSINKVSRMQARCYLEGLSCRVVCNSWVAKPITLPSQRVFDVLRRDHSGIFYKEKLDKSSPEDISITFELYKRCTTVVVRRELFLDVVCDALSGYKYASPSQRADLVLACWYIINFMQKIPRGSYFQEGAEVKMEMSVERAYRGQMKPWVTGSEGK